MTNLPLQNKSVASRIGNLWVMRMKRLENRFENSLGNALLVELRRRQEKNRRYSLRSFARDLRLSPAMLSQVINDNRQLSRATLARIAIVLNLPSLETLAQPAVDMSYHRPDDEISFVSDWYNTALFCLARLKGTQASPQWISRQLGISIRQAKKSLDNLIRLGLVEILNDQLKASRLNVETTTDIPSETIRGYHRQNLKRAMMSLENEPVERRDITSITLAFAEKDMKQAKEYIRKFSRRFTKKFEVPNATDVYTLAVQFIPATVKPVPRQKGKK